MPSQERHLPQSCPKRLFPRAVRPAVAFIALAFLLFAVPAHALRCGNLLVLEGDYVFSVLQKCGPPQYRDERIEYRGIRLKGKGLEQEQFVPVRVEEWLYNFGPQYFMQLLRFENGRLIEIRNLDYGY